MTETLFTSNTTACQDIEIHPDCHVYVIGFDIKKSPSKVGIASNPIRRMATMQTAHHQRLVLGGYWVLPGRDMARALELAFHATQKRVRLTGEWFDLTPEQCMCLLHIGLGVMLNVRAGMEPEQVDEILALARNEHPDSDWWTRKCGSNG